MKLTSATFAVVASSHTHDDAVLLSVSSRESLGGETGLSALVDFAREGSPRKAEQLLQQFAKNTLVRGEAVDETTKQKLKDIGAQLTNRTWMALEQAHRRDQDLLNKHWNAIKLCGLKHQSHLQQDKDGFEVQQVRTHEADMIKCRGLPDHQTALLQQTGAPPGEPAWGTPDSDYRKDGTLKGSNHEVKGWKDRPEDYDTVAWLKDTAFAIYKDEDGNYQRYFKHVNAMYNHEGGKFYDRSLLDVKNELCEVCGELDAFLSNLEKNKPNCDPELIYRAQDPKCTTVELPLIETDLLQWFNNLEEYANTSVHVWRKLKKGCDERRKEYEEMDAHCDEEQQQYEQSFCAYRQGLHSTCAEYQGCHILTEEEYIALISDVLYAADSRKIDWKAIHKIACYIKVLISDGTNQERTWALENCQSGNLNTLATILTGFNETNYLSIIIPEISGNVSCWDPDVPKLIDFKECDMSSVHQYPCTETWMDRYNGLESPETCRECAILPEHMQYSDKKFQDTDHYRLKAEEGQNKSVEYGGGWIFVNELGRRTDKEGLNDLTELQQDGYHLPSYSMKGLRWNEVLIQRVSPNWCDSWGRQSSKWVEDDGASMCVQADYEHVYCMSNHDGKHTWRQQPTSHFAALCGMNNTLRPYSATNSPKCECWPFEEGLEHVCFNPSPDAKGPAKDNVPAPRHVTIHSLEDDGSVVRVSFRGEEKTEVLRVGNYGAFLDGVGCGATTPVKYRVFVRCLGCVTQRTDFHSKDGAQFLGKMEMGRADDLLIGRKEYTYEAWFRSPLEGQVPRELFGGGSSGLVLEVDGNADCGSQPDSTNYRLHFRYSDTHSVWSKTCFKADYMYHVAVTKNSTGVWLFVNGDLETDSKQNLESEHKLVKSFGGGFTDGGQLFNVRIWNYARIADELIEAAAVTNHDLLSSDQHTDIDSDGLAHWWPLTDNIQDIETGAPLTGPQVRYAPVWCSDLEASTSATGAFMRVC